MAKFKIGNVYPPDDYLLKRCAPTGYGLGFHAISQKHNATPENIDTLFSAGWYQYYDTSYENLAGLGFCGGIFVVPTFLGAVQFFFPRMQDDVMPGTYAIRKYEDESWTEWFIQNPAMNVGNEYRTTERYMGKDVYTKLVNFGTMPNASTKSVAHNTSVVIPIRCSGQYGNTQTIPGITSTGETKVSFDKTKIYINSTTDLSTHTAYIQLWYTKD